MGRKSYSVLFHVVISVIGLFMMYPILWTMASSLKPDKEIFINASSLIPSTFVWENYLRGWAGFGNYGFDIFFRNSATVALFTILGTIFSTALVSFGFARLRFRY